MRGRNIGKPSSITDPNGVVTTYDYTNSGAADPFDRLNQIAYASGTANERRTAWSYPDANTVVQYQDQTNVGDRAIQSQTLYDGLGRPRESDLFENSGGKIVTAQHYDALERIDSTTNPSRPGDNLGYTTTYSYDDIGRPLSILTPDGATATTQYQGNVTIATDAAGRQRKTTTDALGRITKVVEDPSGANYTTTYTYL